MRALHHVSIVMVSVLLWAGALDGGELQLQIADGRSRVLALGEPVVTGLNSLTLRRMEGLPYFENEYSRRFKFDSYSNPKLAELRELYRLDEVVAEGRTEWEKQLLLLDWAHRQFRKFGKPTASPRGALEILRGIEEGHTFYCSHYAKVYLSAAGSLGWVDRELALRRHQGNAKDGSSEHTSTEIWSNQHRKWIMMDPTSNMHVERGGVPLSAYEIRQEWFYRDGQDLEFVVGREQRRYRKADLPVKLGYFENFGELTLPADEMDKYGFTAYIPNTNLMDEGEDYGGMFIVKDALCEGTKWHVRKVPANPAVEPYFPLGQSALELRVTNEGEVEVRIKTLTPNLKGFSLRVDETEWRDVTEKWTWKLHPGRNEIEVKTVNLFGIEGPVSKASVEVELRSGLIP